MSIQFIDLQAQRRRIGEPMTRAILDAVEGGAWVMGPQVRQFEADLAAFMADYRGMTAATCLDGATSLFEAQWSSPLAWIFGAEGQGVRPELVAAAQLRIKIPMPGAVESLNVGAAAAVCLFEAVRRRSV